MICFNFFKIIQNSILAFYLIFKFPTIIKFKQLLNRVIDYIKLIKFLLSIFALNYLGFVLMEHYTWKQYSVEINICSVLFKFLDHSYATAKSVNIIVLILISLTILNDNYCLIFLNNLGSFS